MPPGCGLLIRLLGFGARALCLRCSFTASISVLSCHADSMMFPHEGVQPKAEHSDARSCVAGPVSAGFSLLEADTRERDWIPLRDRIQLRPLTNVPTARQLLNLDPGWHRSAIVEATFICVVPVAK